MKTKTISSLNVLTIKLEILLLVHFFFLRRNLFFHFLNHDCQFFFAFFAGFGVDIAGDAFAVGISGRVFTLPEVVVELVDSAGAGFAAGGFVGLEAGLCALRFLCIRWDRCVGFGDLAVDFSGGLLLHGVGDMGVDIQCGC